MIETLNQEIEEKDKQLHEFYIKKDQNLNLETLEEGVSCPLITDHQADYDNMRDGDSGDSRSICTPSLNNGQKEYFYGDRETVRGLSAKQSVSINKNEFIRNSYQPSSSIVKFNNENRSTQRFSQIGLRFSPKNRLAEIEAAPISDLGISQVIVKKQTTLKTNGELETSVMLNTNGDQPGNLKEFFRLTYMSNKLLIEDVDREFKSLNGEIDLWNKCQKQ